MRRISFLLLIVVTAMFASCNKDNNAEEFVGKYKSTIVTTGDLKITNPEGETSNIITPEYQSVDLDITLGSKKDEVIVKFTDNSKSNIIHFPDQVNGIVVGNSVNLDPFTFEFDYNYIGFHNVMCTVTINMFFDEDGNLTITGTTIITIDDQGFTITGGITITGYTGGNLPNIENYLGTYIGYAKSTVDSSSLTTVFGTINFEMPDALLELLHLYNHDVIEFSLYQGEGANEVIVKIDKISDPLPNTINGVIIDDQILLNDIAYNIEIPGITLSTNTNVVGTFVEDEINFEATSIGKGNSTIGEYASGDIFVRVITSGTVKKVL